MKTSSRGIEALTQREGVRLKAYQDVKGVWTIGVGHTAEAGPPAPVKGMEISLAEAYALLAKDIVQYEKAVNDNVKVPLTQNQFDALVSLVYNIGGGAFRTSTLLKRLNEGNYKAAAEQFAVWKRAGPNIVQGLINRRKAEKLQFETPDPVVFGEDVPVETTSVTVEIPSSKVANFLKLVDWYKGV